ncbi:MAG: T9SS type A sorting domain-containing protein [Flavobacteriales bacterium]|nr:T9SS type A sorting domain-containing protein [Flavobacteriales bacterium]MBP6698683.1 T9SS type A sorting domain-containing protein [Flavobacteriales bacterium]
MKHITLLASLLFVFPASAQLTDGDFEAGPGSGAWTEASSGTTANTPLCDAGCGIDAFSGSWYAWFGGWPSGDISSLSQSAVIPTGTTVSLVFWGVAFGGAAGDSLGIAIDGNSLGAITPADTTALSNWTAISVNITPYADGAAHTITLTSASAANSFPFSVLMDLAAIDVDGNSIGLFENEALPGVLVYPNPANDMINMSFNSLKGEAVVSISDVTGKVVSTDRIGEVSRRTYQFNASDLSNGVYMVNVEMNGQRFTERVTVSH